MYRINLDYKTNPKIMKNGKKVECIYNQLDGEIVYESENNGVYHILNARKDHIKVLNSKDKLDELLAKGYNVCEKDMSVNNVVIAPAPLGRLYTVKPADTLDSIANDFEISKNMIIKLNNLKTDKLFIGQKLHIE